MHCSPRFLPFRESLPRKHLSHHHCVLSNILAGSQPRSVEVAPKIACRCSQSGPEPAAPLTLRPSTSAAFLGFLDHHHDYASPPSSYITTISGSLTELRTPHHHHLRVGLIEPDHVRLSVFEPTAVFIHSVGCQPEEAVRRDQEMPSNHLLLPPRPRPPRPPVGQSVAIAASKGYGPEGRDGHRLRLSCARLGATRLIMLQPTTTLHQSLRPCAGVRSTRVILVWYHQKILMERGAIIVLGRAVDPGSLSPPPPCPR